MHRHGWAHGKAWGRVSAQQRQQASAAALAAVPGTVKQVRGVSGVAYAVVVQKADGTKVLVTLDSSFTVVTTTPLTGRGWARPTAEQTQKASAAALAAVPGTVLHVRGIAGVAYAVVVQKSDGSTVLVTVDSSYKVTGTTTLPAKGCAQLTAEQRQKASDAAVAAVPGTVATVRALRGGGYEVLVVKADGTRVLVLLDANYAVTATTPLPDRDHGSLTAEQRQKASDAALAAVPGTVRSVRGIASVGYAVVVVKADGTQVLVTLDADYKVTSTNDLPTGWPGGGHWGGHGWH